MISKKLVAASAAPLILSILSRGESYGYAIIQRVGELSGGEMTWNEGMLYPVLHRMERDGWIRAEWGSSEHGRRRKYYFIEPKGQAALDAERAEWAVVHNALSHLWGAAPCPS